MTRLKIRLTDWGVANNFGDYIEMNRDLKKYPKLYKKILRHELSHSNDGKYRFKDFNADFLQRQNIKRWDLYSFMLKRPKTWIQFLPFYYQPSKGFVYDISRILVWLVVIYIIAFDMAIFLYMKGGAN